MKRIVMLAAGFNKRNGQKRRIKRIYHEEQIDTSNKSALVIDERTGKKAIEYPAQALKEIGDVISFAVGDKDSLENILENYPNVDVIQQGDDFLQNMQLGYNRATEILESLNFHKIPVQPYLYVVCADMFQATSKVLSDTFRRFEERDADFMVGVCNVSKRNPNRKFFHARKGILFSDISMRVSGVSAVNLKEGRGIPQEREYLVGLGYQCKKLLIPENIINALSHIHPSFYPLVTEVILKHYTKIGRSVPFSRAEEAISKTVNADVALIEVDGSLGPDVDTKEDVLRARKLSGLQYMHSAKLSKTIELYNTLLRNNVKKVQIVEDSVYSLRMNRIHDTLKELQISGTAMNKIIQEELNSLYYDMQKTYESLE